MKPHISTALGMSIGFFGSLIYLWTPWGVVLPIALGVFLGVMAALESRPAPSLEGWEWKMSDEEKLTKAAS